MTDLEALKTLGVLLATVMLLVILIPVGLAVYAGLHLSRYDDEEMYLHG